MRLTIPEGIFERVHAHLFQNELEQGAFLFGAVSNEHFVVDDAYLIPASGWAVQLEVYLEMKDEERAKVMSIAMQRGASVVDCHSHPGANDDVWFSASDVLGINAFAQYAKWKLRDRVYIASVWGEASVDVVAWSGKYDRAQPVKPVEITGRKTRQIPVTGSWFREPRVHRRTHNHDV